MKRNCTFVTATPFTDISQFHSKRLGLNKPGGAGSFLFGRCQYGVAASLPGFIIFTKLRHHHAHHRQAIRTADYPCPLSRTRRKDGRRTSSAVSAILPGPRKVGPCRGQNLPRIVTRVTPLFFSYSVTYGELFTVKILDL